MKYKVIPLFLLLTLFVAPAGAAGNPDNDFRKATAAYKKLADSQRERLYRHNWQRVIDRFLAIEKKYPKHRRAPEALYDAGRACRDLYNISRRPEDAAWAAELFEQMADTYPANSLADDALMHAAALFEEPIGDLPRAYLRYRRVADKYPGGDQATSAALKTAALARYAPPAPKATGTGTATASGVTPGETARSELTGIRFWSDPGYTRVVLDLSGPADYTANFLAGDPANGLTPRLYVDVRGAAPAATLAELTEVQDGLLKQVRTGRHDQETVRVVLDLVSLRDYKVFPLSDPPRIVLDVTGERPQIAADQLQITSRPQEKDPIGEAVEQAPAERPLPARLPTVAAAGALRRVVVDAGHGGKDPGAVGPSGLLEKDVVLSIARELARRLKAEVGCEVILTRSGDVFLPLEERTAIANRVGADLFISVHANAASNRDAHGVETYYLNFSKNDKAAAVAARENGTSLKQVGDLELILFDLMANSKINESSRLATEIQKCLVEDLGRHYSQVRDLGVRQGPFYVLLGATMPSVLVEAAFISHPREEKRLNDSRYHEQTAAAIVRAVKQYANSLQMIAAQ